MIYGFFDLWGFRSSVTVLEFLASLPFIGYLSDE